jgi:hypothetical protein
MDYPRLYGFPLGTHDHARALHSEVHWKRRRSAYEISFSWLKARGIPPKVRAIRGAAPVWRDAELLAGFFEHATALDTQLGPSYTDLMAVCGLETGLGILAVEGKAGETFGPLVSEWMDTPGKQARYAWACAMFGVDAAACSALRWQLFHRAASAIIEAKRFRARHAVMLVHDFSGACSSAPDFLTFAERAGLDGAGVDSLSAPKMIDGVSLRFGWVCDECEKEAQP